MPERLAAVEAEAMEAQRDSARKRKHGYIQKVRKTGRRRSTLSPDELAVLMGIE